MTDLPPPSFSLARSQSTPSLRMNAVFGESPVSITPRSVLPVIDECADSSEIRDTPLFQAISRGLLKIDTAKYAVNSFIY